MNWYEEFLLKMKKIQAIEQMPDEDINSGFNLDDMSAFAPPTPDLTQPEQNKPLVMNNKHLIQLPGAEFIVELMPQIVSDPAGFDDIKQMQDAASGSSVADENNKILDSSEGGNPYPKKDTATEDPISKKEEKDKTVKVHKKEASLVTEDYMKEFGQAKKKKEKEAAIAKLKDYYLDMLNGNTIKASKEENKDEEKNEYPKPFMGGIDTQEKDKPGSKGAKDDPRDLGGETGMGYASPKPGSN